ncbi:hypothetical protein [Micromonospora sp. DT227]|uniref:hypothetical protein n=1 Tax=Micromonospora sp. DT227 TaxID=3393433 RepID=UPI003CF647E0
MLTVADIRSHDTRIDTDTAHTIAHHWNTAYPHMRAALTRWIEARRHQLTTANDADQAIAHEEIKNRERLRREIGQLDRGTFRQCTRSPGCFSTSAALSLVPQVIDTACWYDPGLAHMYRLAAVLVDAINAKHADHQADRDTQTVTP